MKHWPKAKTDARQARPVPRPSDSPCVSGPEPPWAACWDRSPESVGACTCCTRPRQQPAYEKAMSLPFPPSSPMATQKRLDLVVKSNRATWAYKREGVIEPLAPRSLSVWSEDAESSLSPEDCSRTPSSSLSRTRSLGKLGIRSVQWLKPRLRKQITPLRREVHGSPNTI